MLSTSGLTRKVEWGGGGGGGAVGFWPGVLLAFVLV